MKMVLNCITAALAAGAIGGCAGAAPGALEPGMRPGGVAESEDGVVVERTAYVMGTVLRARVVAEWREAGVAALESALAAVEGAERGLSSWTSESDVGRVNAAAPGEWVVVDEEVWRWLSAARSWAARTHGAFDPAVGALVDAWDARGGGRRPDPEVLREALSSVGLERFEFDEAGRAVRRLDGGAWLDTGGFGKGAGLDAAGAALREAGVGSALLDFGGQVLAIGGGESGEGWEVSVADPRDRRAAALRLRLRDRSAATTSQSERYVEVGGERIGHVLDPRTGVPVPAWGSVTVVAADALTADALSTALFVMGPERGREWAEGLEGIGVLILEERDGELVPSWNPEFTRYRIN